MKLAYLVALGVSAIVGVSCSSSDGFSCGPGTRADGRECIVAGGSDGGEVNPSAAGAGGDTAVGLGGAGDELAGASAGGEAGQAGADGTLELVTDALSCGSRNITGATVITDPITRDTTWSGVIYLPKGLIVRNEPVLTIKPGTKIIVGTGATIELGWQDSSPMIKALGTVTAPIKFCGETDMPGYWGGLLVRSNVDPNSVLRNVLIADGGATDAGLVTEMPLIMQGVQVMNSGMTGMEAAGFGPGSSTLRISGSGGAPIVATAATGVDIPAGSTLTGNALDLIEVGFTTFDSSVTLRNFGIPYRQLADVNGSKAAVPPLITIEPGVVYQMKHQTLLDFGTATLHALGTSDEPIIFQGLLCDQDPGVCNLIPSDNGHAPGGRLTLTGGTDQQIDYVEMHSMGWTKQRTVPPLDYVPFGALTIATDSPIKIDHLKITLAAGWGIQFSGSGTFTSDSGGIDVNTEPRFSTFTPNPLSVSCGFLMSLPIDTKVSGEPRTNVACYGTSTLSNWPPAASPYILSGFTIENGGTLNLKPGTVLRFLYETTLRIQSGGTLRALGSAASSIQFIEDTTPFSMIGNWNGFIVEPGSSVTLDHVLVDSAGGNADANIVANAPLTLTNSTVSNSLAWGLQKTATDTTDYVTSNTFINNATGDVTTAP